MLSSIAFHRAYLAANFPAWLVHVAMFWVFAGDYVADYVFGSVVGMTCIAVYCHFSKAHRERIDAIPYYSRALLVSASAISIGACSIGLISKLNGGAATFSFTLPIMLGRVGYDYLRKIRFKDPHR
ncbi:hypothetical protein [Burkholderia pseudomultivorans]|uniref:Uncharacterized protein n=1 Tax=Burkholderia pseudomultivorans TaxID=1207504 RepID=A0A132EGB7_9BURK|nr:hypothetical protein [Burkholderia pseudomultivorans]KWF29769.1 hypothetical protein WT56_15335 [Burkholderia pseudomultivorans]VWB77501.1 hypothetical protein BPS26883_03694 [Burkholderia pseudomultivorans]